MITSEEESSESMFPEKKENSIIENIEQSKTQNDNISGMENIIKLLQERLQLYQIAEKKAKQENELSRARRFNRGIKTLKELLNNVQVGKPINESDIPPQLPSHAIDETSANILETNKTESTGFFSFLLIVMFFYE